MMDTVLAAGITDVNPGLTFWTLVTFVILAVLLGRYVWPLVLKQIDERAKAIDGAIMAAQKERAEAEKRLAEAKAAEVNARREASEEAKRVQLEGQRIRDELRKQAEHEVADMKTQAVRDIGDEKAKAAAELRSYAADLAVAAAKRLVSLSMDDKQAQRLAEEFIDSIEKQGPALDSRRPSTL